jgi:hypothetical protein
MIMILACRPWIICLALAKLYIFNQKGVKEGETQWTLTSCESHSTMQGY